ncbi:MAG: hypothetical protein ACTSRU_20330 [Candidatus Hodarchaeales archaeon]
MNILAGSAEDNTEPEDKKLFKWCNDYVDKSDLIGYGNQPLIWLKI